MAEGEREYEVRNEEIERVLRELAALIDVQLPEGVGFALLLFTFDAPGGMFYISNADRGSMLQALQEFVRSNKARGH